MSGGSLGAPGGARRRPGRADRGRGRGGQPGRRRAPRCWSTARPRRRGSTARAGRVAPRAVDDASGVAGGEISCATLLAATARCRRRSKGGLLHRPAGPRARRRAPTCACGCATARATAVGASRPDLGHAVPASAAARAPCAAPRARAVRPPRGAARAPRRCRRAAHGGRARVRVVSRVRRPGAPLVDVGHGHHRPPRPLRRAGPRGPCRTSACASTARERGAARARAASACGCRPRARSAPRAARCAGPAACASRAGCGPAAQPIPDRGLVVILQGREDGRWQHVRRHAHEPPRPLAGELPLPRRSAAATRSGRGSGGRPATRTSSAHPAA